MGSSSQVLVSWTEQEAESEMLELKKSRHVGPDRPDSSVLTVGTQAHSVLCVASQHYYCF